MNTEVVNVINLIVVLHRLRSDQCCCWRKWISQPHCVFPWYVLTGHGTNRNRLYWCSFPGAYSATDPGILISKSSRGVHHNAYLTLAKTCTTSPPVILATKLVRAQPHLLSNIHTNNLTFSWPHGLERLKEVLSLLNQPSAPLNNCGGEFFYQYNLSQVECCNPKFIFPKISLLGQARWWINLLTRGQY
jgi:hypothetical protein